MIAIYFAFNILLLLVIAAGCTGPAVTDGLPETEEPAQGKTTGSIILATTTSTYDSGLLDFLNPVFTMQTGIEVHIVSQGTGAALETGSRGDADLLLVHDRASELKLVGEGVFVDRYDVMYNDFIIVGPAEDPAGVLKAAGAAEALRSIFDNGSIFVSRGDDSGTHRMELRIWNSAGVDPKGQLWYTAVGQGMGDTLNIANESLGYTLTDRGTYAAIKKKLDLVTVLEGDPVLYNQYGVMAVNPDLHPHVKYDLALLYINFLMSEEGQNLIAAYQVNGETLFFPGYGLE